MRFSDPPAYLCRAQRPTPSLPHSAVQHLQALSASWRIAPRATYPPCFMRDPLLGFGTFRGFPSAFSPRRFSASRAPRVLAVCTAGSVNLCRCRSNVPGCEPSTSSDFAPKREARLPANADQHATVDPTAETAESAQTCCPSRPQLPKQPSVDMDVSMVPGAETLAFMTTAASTDPVRRSEQDARYR